MPDIEITLTDNSEEIMAAFRSAAFRAMERCGLKAEDYATRLAPVDTGALRQSISHRADEKQAIIGTNKEYAPYVELGTGQHYSGGRPTPWAYQDEKGNWHRTSGQKPQPFLKPAVADHAQTYKNIIEDTMKNG